MPRKPFNDKAATDRKTARRLALILHKALESPAGDLEALDLVRRGAALDVTDADGNTPLLKAILTGKLSVAETIIDAKPDTAAVNKAGLSALGLAVITGDTALLGRLRESGAALPWHQACDVIEAVYARRAPAARRRSRIDISAVPRAADDDAILVLVACAVDAPPPYTAPAPKTETPRAKTSKTTPPRRK